MARKKPIKNTPPSSDEEEEQDGGLGENGAVEKVEKEQLSVKDRESVSDPDEDLENTAPSPNVSDFIIKPIVCESPAATKRSAESEPSGTLEKKKKVDTPAIVLGLSKQNNYSKSRLDFKGKQSGRLAFKGEESGKLKDKTDTKRSDKTVTEHSDKIDSKRLSELLSEEMLRSGMGNGLAAMMKEEMGAIQSEKSEEIGEKWRKLQQQMLELYIKRLELVQEQTKLVLHELESSKE